MSRVFVGLGSNEGDRLANLSEAIRALGIIDHSAVVQVALISETAAVGGPPQGPYLNTVVELHTAHPPLELLAIVQGIERHLGRVPSPVRWAPRPIDLDLLLYDDRVIEQPELSVPHPRMHERRFVLEPLAQLAPEMTHPVLRRSIAELLAQLPIPSLAG